MKTRSGKQPWKPRGLVQAGTPVAWLAIAGIDAQGRQAKIGQPGALVIVAACVHEDYPVLVADRLRLLNAIMGRAEPVIDQSPSLIVLPGGFFGCTRMGLAQKDVVAIDSGVRAAQRGRPSPEITIAAGVDEGLDHRDEGVWVWPTGDGPAVKIVRGATAPAGRTVGLLGGALRAAFFTCGEFTGSPTVNNGPFVERKLLRSAAEQLPGCRLVVDLAHRRIKGTVGSKAPSQRLVHQRQMLAFKGDAATVLTHHHPGAKTHGRFRDNSQSTWILYRGGPWCEGTELEVEWPES